MSVCPRTNKECKHIVSTAIVNVKFDGEYLCVHPDIIGKIGLSTFHGYSWSVPIDYMDEFIKDFVYNKE